MNDIVKSKKLWEFQSVLLAPVVASLKVVELRGLLLKHRGSQGYLTWQQRQEVIDWLQQKNNWQLSELQTQLEVEYGVVFSSLQSYYSLFHDARISWKKSQKSNSRQNPELVAKKKLKLKLGWRRIERKSNQVD